MTGMDNMFKFAKKCEVKVAYGTDLLFSPKGRKERLKDLTLRMQWSTSPEIMVQATGTGGEVVGLGGQRNPYGKVGVIEEGALLLQNSRDVVDMKTRMCEPLTFGFD